jgi:hypothetical protein
LATSPLGLTIYGLHERRLMVPTDLYDANSVEAARERLAKIIVSLVADTKDPAEIQAIAVQEMTKGA